MHHGNGIDHFLHDLWIADLEFFSRVPNQLQKLDRTGKRPFPNSQAVKPPADANDSHHNARDWLTDKREEVSEHLK
jgi:hypothetical protein